MTVPSVPAGIGATSVSVAWLRAVEVARSDRLFDDPYAQRVVALAGLPDPADAAEEAADFPALMREQVAVRTRFFDDSLLAAAGAGCRQVVLLASGMDSRAVRLVWPPGTWVFDVDQPDVLGFKEAAFGGDAPVAGAARVVVPVDLRTDWVAALVDHGFRSGEPVAWLAEGILYALRPDEADQFLGALTAASGPGSRLYFDHLTDSTTLHHARAAVDPALNEMWHGGPTEPPGAWLRRYGWTARVHDLVDLAAGFGRPVPAAFDPARPQSARAWLVEARRP